MTTTRGFGLRLTIALAVLLGACDTLAARQRPERSEERPRPRRSLLEELDRDGDGRLSAEEIVGRERTLGRLDRNGDGFVDADELPSRPRRPRFIDRLDSDGDGRVAPDEFDGPPHAFAHFDRNFDGFIDDSEAPTGPPPRRRGSAAERSDQ